MRVVEEVLLIRRVRTQKRAALLCWSEPTVGTAALRLHVSLWPRPLVVVCKPALLKPQSLPPVLNWSSSITLIRKGKWLYDPCMWLCLLFSMAENDQIGELTEEQVVLIYLPSFEISHSQIEIGSAYLFIFWLVFFLCFLSVCFCSVLQLRLVRVTRSTALVGGPLKYCQDQFTARDYPIC